MPQTIVEKIAQTHLAEGPNRPLRTGDFVSIRPHRVMTHDNTSAVMSKFKGIGAKKVHDPNQIVFTLDHDIQNQDESNLKKYRAIEAFGKEQGIDFYPAGSGIGHQIMVERGYVVPGSFVVASDSHSNMYGALGAIGTPIVRTDAAAVWATGEFWWQIPRSVQVVLEGKPSGRRDGQRRHHHAVRTLQPRRSSECRDRIHRTGRRVAFDGCAPLDLQHDNGVGAARRIFSSRRGHDFLFQRRACATEGTWRRAVYGRRY